VKTNQPSASDFISRDGVDQSLIELRALVDRQSARIAALEAQTTGVPENDGSHGPARNPGSNRWASVVSQVARLGAARGSGRGRWTVRMLLSGLLILAVFAGAGGVALANIPDAGSAVFHGCVSTSGTLRLIDPSKGAKCTSKEHGVSRRFVQRE
jgi:hypothetical protein